MVTVRSTRLIAKDFVKKLKDKLPTGIVTDNLQVFWDAKEKLGGQVYGFLDINDDTYAYGIPNTFTETECQRLVNDIFNEWYNE